MSVHGNPQASLDALTPPHPLTLGKIAVLCRLDSPLLVGNVDDLCECLAALYVIEMPLNECVVNFKTLKDDAIVWGDSLTPTEYRMRLAAALDAVAAFFEMIPRPAASSKKNSATDGSQSLSNGSATPTGMKSDTSSGDSRASRRPSSGAAMHKAQEV